MINKYPYTDASQLNLDWFLTEFKKLYDAWLQMQQNNAQMVIKYDNMVLKFGTLTETVNTFTAFVTNYFDNLDVQQEINNKLDEMVQQGTLQPLLQPFVVDALPDVVSDWLDENVDPVGSAVMVDSSLTIGGAAADALVTGDGIRQIQHDLGDISNLNTDDKSNVVAAINEVNEHFLGDISQSVADWLDAHPEATTTVEDNSLTYEKMVTGTLGYITPEMFGAKGDGTSDDTSHIQDAINYSISNKIPLILLAKTYFITTPLVIDVSTSPYNKWLQFYGQGFKSIITNDNTFVGNYLIELRTSSTNYKGLVLDNFQLLLNSAAGGIKITGAIGQNSILQNIWIIDNEGVTLKEGIYCANEIVCCVFRRIIARNIYGAAIHLTSQHSTLISECDFALCKYAIYLGGGSNNRIEKCRIDEGDFGIYCNGSSNLAQPSKIYPSNATLINTTITGNRFENNKATALVLIAYGTGYLAHQGTVINENYFDSLDVANGKYGIGLARCSDISIKDNVFKGAPESAAPAATKSMQNIFIYANISDLTLANNICASHVVNEEIVKSNTLIHNDIISNLSLVNNLEVTQTSFQINIINETFSYKTVDASSGTFDASVGNIFAIKDNTPTITSISGLSSSTYKEITLVFNGTATVNNSGTLVLKDGQNASFTRYSTLTLIGCYVNNAIRWVEKCRTIH